MFLLRAKLLLQCLSISIYLLEKCSADDCPQGWKIYESGMTNDTRSQVVEYHNERRLQIARGDVTGQPRGMSLNCLKYDEDTLEGHAKYCGDFCEKRHIFPSSKLRTEGQNIYWQSDPEFNATQDWFRAVTYWFKENQDYSYQDGTSINGKPVEHYTQCVWDNAKFVGCYFLVFAYLVDEDLPYKRFYVCNYDQGNVRGEKPYSRSGDCPDLCDH